MLTPDELRMAADALEFHANEISTQAIRCLTGDILEAVFGAGSERNALAQKLVKMAGEVRPYRIRSNAEKWRDA